MITGDFPPAVTGVGDYTRRLVDSLAEAGAVVQVFTGSVRDAVEPSARDWGPGVVARVLRAVDRLGPRAVVHIQYPALAYGRKSTINLLPGILKLRRPHCRVVVTMHEFRSMRRRWRLRVVPMLLAADAVILPDELDAPHVRRWARRARGGIVSIPIGANILPASINSADRARWRAQLRLPGAEPIVVFFGGVHEHKGILELITAVRGLRQRGVPARLLVVGAPDPDPGFRDRVERLLAPDQGAAWARWMANAPPEVVSPALEAADIAALPFRSGAMANRGSLLVVLAHGLPAVTTRTDATPASFGPETGMALVSPDDATGLQTRLEELLGSPDACAALRQAGLAYAKEFSWPTIACQTLQVYRRLYPEGQGRLTPD